MNGSSVDVISELRLLAVFHWTISVFFPILVLDLAELDELV